MIILSIVCLLSVFSTKLHSKVWLSKFSLSRVFERNVPLSAIMHYKSVTARIGINTPKLVLFSHNGLETIVLVSWQILLVFIGGFLTPGCRILPV